MALSKKWKDKWVKALRSGKYKKGKGKLRSQDNKFCCLGVLCDIKGRKWHKSKSYNPNYAIKTKYGILDEFGDGDNNSTLRGLPVDTLADMNDGGYTSMGTSKRKAYSFKQIANWIEKNL